jgi:transposase
MNRAPFQWIGIDVCKRWLDVYVRGSHDSFRVSNDAVGFLELQSRIPAN